MEKQQIIKIYVYKQMRNKVNGHYRLGTQMSPYN